MNMGKLIAPVAICCFLISACVSTTTGRPEVVADDGDAAELNYTLGVRYFQNGSYELARDRLELAIELDPRLALAHSTLGMVYEAMDIPRLANQHYEESVRVGSRDFNVQNAYAVYLCREKDFEKAARHFDRAIAHPENDNSFVTMTNAGMCFLADDTAKAEAYFRGALERRPGYGEALLQLCLMKYAEEDYLSARAFMQRFMSTNATTAGVLYLASRIEDLLGNDRGRTDFEDQLLREFPTSPEARRVLGTS